MNERDSEQVARMFVEGGYTVTPEEKDADAIRKVDLGVIEAEGESVRGFQEKPTFTYDVSMGIYCMEPSILELIPRGVPFGFDDLMYRMLEKGEDVRIYRHRGSWKDIGRPEDFKEAQELVDKGEFPMLGI